jgi:hypothetical protein
VARRTAQQQYHPAAARIDDRSGIAEGVTAAIGDDLERAPGQPPSDERLSTVSMSPSSAAEFFRPSANASSVFPPAMIAAGIRKVS